MNHFVSVIVPCLNEEGFIGNCLQSLENQNYPKDKMEVLVVDGMSKDKTREIIKKYPFAKLLDNPKHIIPCAMNIGIRQARGDIVIKADAHTEYSRDFVSNSVKYLTEYNAGNVGGFLVNKPKDNKLVSKAICEVLSNPFGVGNSPFRVKSEEAKEADTAVFGCFFRDIFKEVGFYDERMERSEDLELNKRIKKAGKKIYFIPFAVGNYYYKQSSLAGFLKRCFIDGTWITYPLRFGIFAFHLRHIVPLVFVSSLIVLIIVSFLSKLFLAVLLMLLGAYLFFNILSSVLISIKKKNITYLSVLPLLFASLHFGYGIGSLWGFVKKK